MQLPDVIANHIDLISDFSSLIGALACLYVGQVILRERAQMVKLQRVALYLLSFSLFLNALTEYPTWMMINGHRPSGALVSVMLMFNLLVMAYRGHVIYQPGRRNEDRSQSSST